MPRLILTARRHCLLILAALTLAASSGHTAELVQSSLTEFEGRYAYFNRTSILFSQSPRDGVLYSILGGAKYALKTISPGVFEDRQGSRVVFERGAAGAISGYSLYEKNATNFFARISREKLPKTTWFARRSPGGAPYHYRYSAPPDLKDGLEIGSLQDSGMDTKLISQLVERIADDTFENVHSVLLIKNGKLIVEEYFYQYDRDTLHPLRSATKSFVSALVGIALDQHLIRSTEEKVLSFFPEYELRNLSPEKNAITIEHLLSNQSGLACDDGDQSSPGNELKMGLSPDWVRFILDLPMLDAPGRTGRYCSGGVIVLGRIVEKASQTKLSEFAAANLFGKLGITDYKWEFKPNSSSSEDFCQLHLRPRDMAKFGLLYMNEGRWKGNQVISREWVRASLSKHSVVRDTDYGYLWWRQWLNMNGTRMEGVTAKGNGGQRIYLWQSLNMLVVITGGSYNTQSPADEMQIKYILPAAMK